MARELARRLTAAFDANRGGTVIEEPSGGAWSGERVLTLAEAVEAALRAHGVTAGEPVIVFVSNDASDFAALLGVWRVSAVAVPVHRTTPPGALAPVLEASRARLLVDLLGPPSWPVPGTRSDEDGPLWLFHRGAAVPPADPVLADALLVVFTSGSTGVPKGVVMSDRAYARKLDAIDSLLRFDAATRTLLLLQITFSFGMWVSLLTLTRGGTLVLGGKFEAAATLRALADRGITRTALIPTMLRALVAARHEPDVAALLARFVAERGLRHLLTGGEILPASLAEAVTGLFPEVAFHNIFGLTETCTSDFFLGGEGMRRRPGAIGRPSPGVAYRIAAGDGGPVAIGEVGELQIRTETIMSGYLGAPELTAAAFVDGYFRTGDLAREGADGLVEIVGRAKEVIARSGNKVYPLEVELAFSSHPGVAHALATGIADERVGERIHVAVVPKAGASLSAEVLRRWAAERLDRFKMPDAVHILDGLPLGRTGKADRSQLRALLMVDR